MKHNHKKIILIISVLICLLLLIGVTLHYQEKKIYSDVFRYVLTEKAKRFNSQPNKMILYLQQIRSLEFWQRNIDKELMLKLHTQFDTSNIILRDTSLANLSKSQRRELFRNGLRDPLTGRGCESISVGPIKWIGLHTVEVEVSFYIDRTNGSVHNYILSRENGTWHVKDIELVIVS